MKYDKETIEKSINIIMDIIRILQEKYNHEEMNLTLLRLANLGIINIDLNYDSDLDKEDNKMKLEFKLFDVDKLNKIKYKLKNY